MNIRSKHSFYRKYYGNQTGARVKESWGDAEVLSISIAYHDDGQYNVVTDSLGNEVEYHYDERKLCTRTIFADDSEKRSECNEWFELIGEIDEEGQKTSYTYNHIRK